MTLPDIGPTCDYVTMSQDIRYICSHNDWTVSECTDSRWPSKFRPLWVDTYCPFSNIVLEHGSQCSQYNETRPIYHLSLDLTLPFRVKWPQNSWHCNFVSEGAKYSHWPLLTTPQTVGGRWHSDYYYRHTKCLLCL